MIVLNRNVSASPSGSLGALRFAKLCAMRLRRALPLAFMIVTTACAPVTQKINIDTMPSGAQIEVAGQHLVSPCTVELPTKSDYQVIANKEGYQNGAPSRSSLKI